MISSELNDALEKAGYSYRKYIRGFSNQGYITTHTDSEGKKRTQIGRRVKDVPIWVYNLRIKVSDIDDGDSSGEKAAFSN